MLSFSSKPATLGAWSVLSHDIENEIFAHPGFLKCLAFFSGILTMACYELCVAQIHFDL